MVSPDNRGWKLLCWQAAPVSCGTSSDFRDLAGRPGRISLILSITTCAQVPSVAVSVQVDRRFASMFGVGRLHIPRLSQVTVTSFFCFAPGVPRPSLTYFSIRIASSFTLSCSKAYRLHPRSFQRRIPATIVVSCHSSAGVVRRSPPVYSSSRSPGLTERRRGSSFRPSRS